MGGRRYDGGIPRDGGIPWDALPPPDGGPLMTCVNCVGSWCQEPVQACLAGPVCLNGIACTVLRCAEGDLGCVLGCFDGDLAAAVTGVKAVGCVASQCGTTCLSVLPIPIE